MRLKPLKTEQEYTDTVAWVVEQFDRKGQSDSPDGETLQVALFGDKVYEDQHYAIPAPDSIEAVRLKMEEKGMRNKDFVGKLGSKATSLSC